MGVEDGGAGVAAGGVVGGKEAHGLVLEAAAGIDVPEGLRNIVVEDIRVVFFDNAFKGGNRPVVDGICGGVALYVAVGYAKGEVGVRVKCFLRLKFHLGAHVVTVNKVKGLGE